MNGGTGLSDTRMPAPAGQPGEVSRHHSQPVKSQVPHELLPSYSDEFSGSTLDGAWSWEAGDNAASTPPEHSVGGGVLSVDVQHADQYVDVNNAWVLLRDAPDGDYVVETKVRLDVPDEGCCFNYAQAGIAIYDDQDNFVKLTNTSIWDTRQTEWAKEMSPV
ncbi:MAG: hypothetical protein ACR2HA_08265, partial [Nocardioides sp.]